MRLTMVPTLSNKINDSPKISMGQGKQIKGFLIWMEEKVELKNWDPLQQHWSDWKETREVRTYKITLDTCFSRMLYKTKISIRNWFQEKLAKAEQSRVMTISIASLIIVSKSNLCQDSNSLIAKWDQILDKQLKRVLLNHMTLKVDQIWEMHFKLTMVSR